MHIQHQFRNFPLRIIKALIVVLIVIIYLPQSLAEEMSHGEMAGIIRSAGHPCAKVLELQSTSENSWKVQCNSGSFNVTRNEDGKFTINSSEE